MASDFAMQEIVRGNFLREFRKLFDQKEVKDLVNIGSVHSRNWKTLILFR